jgi:sulfite reductase alpha subunit
MAKKPHDTPMLDELEKGPWPSFVTGLKRLAQDNDMAVDLLGQLESSYRNKFGYWKGGTVGVYGYGAGVIPRFTELKGKDVMFQGCSTENVQPAFDAFNAIGFDLGGAGAAMRTSMSCVGAARCEMSCYDEQRALRGIINSNLDEMHRPSLPYKFKFKFSGCPNDCVNSIQRSDMATIGTWRDNIRTDEKLAREWYAAHGTEELIDNVITRCPTKAVRLRKANGEAPPAHVSRVRLDDAQCLEIDNHDCVRCMHCLNVMPGALLPGSERGVSILMGGKSVLKIGSTIGIMVVPFMKLASDEDFAQLQELARKVLDFFAENALDHERLGETIERIGLANFLEAVELPVDPSMVLHPRTNPYVRTDDWAEQVAKSGGGQKAA